jgi:hypothetical protein
MINGGGAMLAKKTVCCMVVISFFLLAISASFAFAKSETKGAKLKKEADTPQAKIREDVYLSAGLKVWPVSWETNFFVYDGPTDKYGVKSLSVSHLIIRPSIINQFVKELPFKTAKELIHLYHGQPWQRVITSARTRVLPKEMRINTYRIIKDIAKRYSIECHTCGCKNPDLPWEFCSPWIDFRDTIPLSSVERRAGHPSNGWVGEDTQLDLFKDATVCKN